jgi:hypothetical protein
MERAMKHDCGCITKKFEKGVAIFPCDLHRANEKWVYIALQHEEISKAEEQDDESYVERNYIGGGYSQ